MLNEINQQVFVIGGSRLYDEALQHEQCSRVHLTRVNYDAECDVFIDVNKHLKQYFDLKKTSQTFSHDRIAFDFQLFQNKNCNNQDFSDFKYKLNEEQQYLNFLDEIIHTGFQKDDRTNTGTISKFGGQMRFDLSQSFPLLTTKNTFLRGIAEELFWFIKGSTDAKILQKKNVKIWDDNGSRSFLDQLGFTQRDEGDLGPIYGFQWRHFGAKYIDPNTNYTGQGVDQLQNVIKQIKNDPTSRRIIMTAWNPCDLHLMALPPCHLLVQFYVQNNKLSCLMYQRSADMGLGVPFNIASYSLLTCMIAEICNLERGEFVHTLGDMHVYKNHVEQLKNQILRTPSPFPILKFKRKVQNIEEFNYDDIEIIGYHPQSKIKMSMAV